MYLTPCELAVRDILPAIRALIVIELYNRGLKQKEIAKLLGLTQPAVSYYLNRRRAKRIKLLEASKEVMREVKEIVEYLLSEETDASFISEKFCDMCHLSREIVFKDNAKALEVFQSSNCEDSHK